MVLAYFGNNFSYCRFIRFLWLVGANSISIDFFKKDIRISDGGF